jgi:hypothetical protein
LSDAHRVWCGAHPLAVVRAGESLGVAPSRFVRHKAEVEQAFLEGDTDRVQSLILEWVGQQMTASDTDPHPDVEAMPSWELEAQADFERACLAAFDAG